MQCNECDQDLPKGAAFCPQCGARIGSEAEFPYNLNLANQAGAQRLKPGRERSAGNQPPEEELWSGTYSAKAMVGPAIGAAILTVLGMVGASIAGPAGWAAVGIGSLLVWGGLALLLMYRRLTVRYRLTTYRFFHETGLLSRTRNRIEVIDINDVTLSQGLIERMLNVGTVFVQSSDVTHPQINLPGIEGVKYVADLIDDTRRAERQRRGLFMENI
ncbi:MAG: PH domain-containing protein [Planctomycetes bacterium]|nr:PH domain-containing protein [Planctomycetota bacterium]